jgi:hypothetical protein
MSNRLELLSNELLLDIFEYLDACNLYQAFYGLNHRFNDLLRSAGLHINFNSKNKDNTTWDTLASFVKPSQIRALSSYDNVAIDKRFLPSAEQNLRLLCLHSMDQTAANEICEHVPVENQIKCLYIKEKQNYGWRKRRDRTFSDMFLLDHGHRFTSLVNMLLSFDIYEDTFPVVLAIFPQLRRLSITKGYWTPNLFQFFQTSTPNLRSLKLQTASLSSAQVWTCALKHIYELHINYSGDMINLPVTLCMFPCLHRLHIDWTTNRQYAIPNGTQWQELIEKYLPNLKQFTLNINEGIDEQILKTFYIGEFWSTRKVNAKMMINKPESRYRLVKTIYFGRQWQFDYFHEDNLCCQ